MIDDDIFEDFFRSMEAVGDEGAALDGMIGEREFGPLPRVLRYALLRAQGATRLVADVRDLAPALAGDTARWAENVALGWQGLARSFDDAAAAEDRPVLRGLADVVRCLSMTVTDVVEQPRDAARVLAALSAGLEDADRRRLVGLPVLARLERIVVGWSNLAAAGRGVDASGAEPALTYAERRGKGLSGFGLAAAADVVERKARTRAEADARLAMAEATVKKGAPEERPGSGVDSHHVLVCPAVDTKANPKAKDATRGHERAVGQALPLVPTPDLAAVRRTLVTEFPYAPDVVDRLLGPIVGRRHVAFPPIVIVGSPGSGKSRLARRFAECLGVGVWRTDGARADGNVFGGTDRRWNSAEPCHPFLACSRHLQANPMVITDEIDKASTRSDYGRLWDALLAFLEPESAARYPDPALQVDLDLRHVSYVATANALTPLPSPLLDRFRVVEMPDPRASDLDALVPPLMAALLAERELDGRWREPLSAAERTIVAAHWHGGSVRRLRECLAILTRARDTSRTLQ